MPTMLTVLVSRCTRNARRSFPAKVAAQAIPTSEASSDTHPNEHCLEEIGATGAWLAADGGRTIPLSNGTSIHLFGDTMLDASTPDDPNAFEFVGNSIGLVHCAGGQYSLDYIWAVRDGARGAFFDIGVPGVRLWPVDGFEHDGRLHVLLGKIIATDEGLGFDCIGTVWATIENPLDAPADWRIAYQDLTAADTHVPDKGITVENGYAYLFSSLLVGNYPQPAILLRVPLSGLDAPAERLPELRMDGGNELVVTYACNTLGAPLPAREDLGLYYPKTITIDVARIEAALGVAGN